MLLVKYQIGILKYLSYGTYQTRGDSALLPEEPQEQEEILDISFAYENWTINYRKTILQQMQDASEEEKRAQAEELSLLNLFKLRQTRDLGFNCYVYSEIQNDEDFIICVKKTIGQIVSTVAEAPRKLRVMQFLYRKSRHIFY